MTHQGYDLRKLVTKPLSPTCARGETTTPEKIWPTCYVCASWMVDQINALAASWEREVAKISLVRPRPSCPAAAPHTLYARSSEHAHAWRLIESLATYLRWFRVSVHG